MRQLSQQEFLALPDSEKLAEIRRRGLDRDPAVQAKLAELAETYERNPLQRFKPHSQPQLEFLSAKTPIVAAFAGNRFGKTTALVVRSLIEALPRDALPRRLHEFKRYDAPTAGWILCPTEDKLWDSLKPAFDEWVPKSELVGGAWGKAFHGERMELRFVCGSTITFKTYKMEPSTLGGAKLHYVGYDEPPPKTHRGECKMRLVDHEGFEMFAMTPIRANTTWIRRDLWRNREAPNVTVVKASIHDNPLLSASAKEEALSIYPEHERRAREKGDFMDLGGLIYPDFEDCVLKDPLKPDFVRSLNDVVIGIDPGIRNAGIVWVGFDSENVAYVFNEGLLQDKEAADYATLIKAENKRLGLNERDVQYVCDPAARQRGQVNAETVMSALAKHEIYAAAGQNDHEAGFDQMRSRMRYKRFWVDPTCYGLRDEADDYAAKEPEEGKDDSKLDPIKGNDHRLDALRYAVMERFWDPVMEEQAPQRNLGWKPGRAPAYSEIRPQREAAPLGFMS